MKERHARPQLPKDTNREPERNSAIKEAMIASPAAAIPMA